MTGSETRSGSATKLLAAATSLVSLALIVWVRTNDVALAAAVVVALLVVLAGIIFFLRSRTASQVVSAVEHGYFDIAGFLVTESLPGNWPTDARRTMGLARNNAPAMPVQLRIVGSVLYLEKTKYGSHPFTAEIALGDIASVTAGRASAMPIGATLNLRLRDNTEVVLHLHLAEANATVLAKTIEDRASASPSAEPPAGIVITSPAP